LPRILHAITPPEGRNMLEDVFRVSPGALRTVHSQGRELQRGLGQVSPGMMVVIAACFFGHAAMVLVISKTPLRNYRYSRTVPAGARGWKLRRVTRNGLRRAGVMVGRRRIELYQCSRNLACKASIGEKGEGKPPHYLFHVLSRRCVLRKFPHGVERFCRTSCCSPKRMMLLKSQWRL
jgi:hypothetical protein